MLMSWSSCLDADPVPEAVSWLPANPPITPTLSYREMHGQQPYPPQSPSPGKAFLVAVKQCWHGADGPHHRAELCGVMCLQSVFQWGGDAPGSRQHSVPQHLGLRKHRGCGKETGRERESWLGHGAQLREGHGMWLATGSTHSSTGAGRQTLAPTPVGPSPAAPGQCDPQGCPTSARSQLCTAPQHRG